MSRDPNHPTAARLAGAAPAHTAHGCDTFQCPSLLGCLHCAFGGAKDKSCPCVRRWEHAHRAAVALWCQKASPSCLLVQPGARSQLSHPGCIRLGHGRGWLRAGLLPALRVALTSTRINDNFVLTSGSWTPARTFLLLSPD